MSVTEASASRDLDLRLREKAIVVTGAASGMGKAATRFLASAGARVALCDINLAGVEAVCAELGDRDGERLAIEVDVSRQTSVSRAIDRIVEHFGTIDALIHFAGILDSHRLEDVTTEIWDRVVNVNLRGTFFAVQAVAPIMRRQGHGRIVLTASDSARAGSTVSGPAYAASKGGVIALTRTLAAYLGPDGISVNAVCPGLALTEMSAGWSRDLIAQVAARTPLRRLAEPEDIARVAICLASEITYHMTGEVVEVNGGIFFD